MAEEPASGPLVLKRLRGGVKRGAFAALVVNSLALPVAFLVEVFTARTIGAAEYGNYTFAISLTVVLGMVAKVGLDEATIRFLPTFAAERNWSLFKGVLVATRRAATVFSLALALVVSVVLYLYREQLTGTLFPTLLVAATLLPVLGLLNLQSAALLALKRVLLARGPAVLVRPALVVVFLALADGWWPGSVDGPAAMSANLLATAIAAAMVAAFLHTAVPEGARRATAQFKWREWMTVGLQLVTVSGFWLVQNRMDILLVGVLVGTRESGVYAAAARLSLLIGLGLNAVNTILAPMISELYSQSRRAELRSVVTYAVRLTLVLTAPIFGLVVVFGREALALFGPDFVDGYGALVILSGGQLFSALSGSVGRLSVMTGHQAFAGKVFSASLCLNLVLNLAIIPLFGLVGAAIATALTTAAWNVALIVYVRRVLRVDSTVFGRHCPEGHPA